MDLGRSGLEKKADSLLRVTAVKVKEPACLRLGNFERLNSRWSWLTKADIQATMNHQQRTRKLFSKAPTIIDAGCLSCPDSAVHAQSHKESHERRSDRAWNDGCRCQRLRVYQVRSHPW